MKINCPNRTPSYHFRHDIADLYGAEGVILYKKLKDINPIEILDKFQELKLLYTDLFKEKL